MTTFPISHDATWADPSGKGFHIHALSHVTSQGQLYLEVTTSTNSWGLGFTGGTAVLVKAADDTIIWASRLRVAGVDAKSVFWGRSSRVDKYWDEWCPVTSSARRHRWSSYLDTTRMIGGQRTGRSSATGWGKWRPPWRRPSKR